MESDKNIEHSRYNSRAIDLLKNNDLLSSEVDRIRLFLKTPYEVFYHELRKYLKNGYAVLEIGSGTGAHTGELIKSNANITATDISLSSLEVIEKKYGKPNNLELTVADMEYLPFADEFFDVVVSAGSLSYGDNTLVMNEIRRVLKSNGVFICVDSLSHNPIYRFNRWIHYVKGDRTLSTLIRMPRNKLIESYRHSFGEIDIKFFGSISWAMPLFHLFIKDDQLLKKVSDKFDELIMVNKSAFKFVMIAKKIKN